MCGGKCICSMQLVQVESVVDEPNLLAPSKLGSQEGLIPQCHCSLGGHVEVHLFQVVPTAVQGCYRPLCLSPHLQISTTDRSNIYSWKGLQTKGINARKCTYAHNITRVHSTYIVFCDVSLHTYTSVKYSMLISHLPLRSSVHYNCSM